MKIAYIGQKGIPMTQGGIEAHVENLAIEMVNLGHEVYVYARPHYTNKRMKKYKGIHIINLPSIHTKNLDAISHTFLASIHACFQKYDIIHYHAVGPSLMSFIPKFFSRSKIVGSFHCLDRMHKKWGIIAKLFLWIGEWAICFFPHKTIAISDSIAKYAKKYYKKDLVVIANGFKIHKDYDTNTLEELNIVPKKYFLAISRLIGHKGLQYFIKAFNELNNKDYQAIIVGDTYYNNKYFKYIKKLSDTNDNIILTGQRNGQTLNQLFTNAYCFVIPSEGEGLSITLLEAMAHELPVIASEIEGNQLFIDKKLVYSFKNKNSSDLKDKMQYMINNYDKSGTMIKDASEYVRKNYSWNIIANKIEILYKSLI